jgi:NADH-quinone oxidoreductase subunit G
MPELISLTIDGKPVRAAQGTLVINAAKSVGIEIPAFCYWEGLSLQAACRMCLVEVEKAPKLMTACTLPVAEGMVVRTETPVIAQARKSMLEFLLTNHPLDCPVCDKGGECELQDMAFRYGAGESRYTEQKLHVPEKQWSPVVFFDAPRCILCYRCVRICGEGMGVGALGVVFRGAVSEIAPSHGDHLECDECGMCIDICPVGALTSGTYRYQTRPWEMEHVGTICAHCSNGCKTTLGVRNDRIIRGNNRDRSGVNGEFLCIKGRYAFDFVHHPQRLTSPLARVDGKLSEVAWSRAFEIVGTKFKEILERGGKFGVIGSNRITNEESYFLQKFARQALRTSNIDHQRTGDVAALMDALSGRQGVLATIGDLYHAKSVLVIGADLAQQQPLIAFQIRANWRHHSARVFTVSPGPVREDKFAVRSVRTTPGNELAEVEKLRDELKTQPDLMIIFGDAVQGNTVQRLVAFGDSLGIPVKYICLVDYANSRGASDMGVLPHLGPGYQPAAEPGLSLDQMLAAEDLDALWVTGANPLRRRPLEAARAFVVVSDLFLTETAQRADVIFPASAAYEKNGTVTNVCGQVQRLRAAMKTVGTKSDLEIIGHVAKEMGVNLGIWSPEKIFEEIRARVHGYNLPASVVRAGAAAVAVPLNGRVPHEIHADLIESARDTLFTSGTLGRYSSVLSEVIEGPGELYKSS